MKSNSPAVIERSNPPIELRQKLLDGSHEITVLPKIANEAIQFAKNPDCSIQEFSRLVERDTKLTTELLSLANSSMFSGGAEVTKLQQAVVRLGLKQCRNLILASSVASMMKNLSIEENWIREVFTQHGFATATTCVHLNRHFRLGFQGDEFTAGLLHDLGRSLLAVILGAKFIQADPLEFVEDASILDHERSVLGTDHCEFGAWFAHHNRLPETLVTVIRWHHQPQLAPGEQKLVALAAAADHIANHLQRFDSGDGYQPETNHGMVVLEEALGTAIVDRFTEEAPGLIQQMAKLVKPN